MCQNAKIAFNFLLDFSSKEPLVVLYTGTVASAFSNLNVFNCLPNPQTCQCKESTICRQTCQQNSVIVVCNKY